MTFKCFDPKWLFSKLTLIFFTILRLISKNIGDPIEFVIVEFKSIVYWALS